MFGKNPKRPAVNSDGTSLDVQDIFPTIQGEGPNTGQPAIFIRLGGCNLACRFCDTEFETFRPQDIADMVSKVKALALSATAKKIRHLVVITGGEPFRQNIEPLCRVLLAEGFRIQIETNGTLYRPLPKQVEIICSPKNTGNGYSMIRDDLLSHVSAFKFIVSAHDTKYDHIAEIGQGKLGIPVYIQPMDEYSEDKNRENLELVKKLALENGYNISLQTHKLLGVA